MAEGKKFNMNEFLENKKNYMENVGYLDEISTRTLRNLVMLGHTREFVKIYYLDRITIDGDKTILKWDKRLLPLSEDDLNKLYKPE